MIINEIIEEEDEDNNNTKILEKNKNSIENIDKDNNIKKINNINTIKNGSIQKINDKNKKNKKMNYLYKSVSASKENKMKNPSNEKLGNNLIKKFSNNYYSTRDKIFMDYRKENNKKVELPSLSKNINISSNINNISDTNKIINNNENESPSTSAFTNSNKKNLINDHNFTEEISKYRMGLLSANSSSNNTPIIPIIPIKRPVSNFNFGGNPLLINDIYSSHYDLNNKNNINIINNKNNNNITGKNNLNKSPVVINKFNERNDKENNFSKTSNKNIFNSLDLNGKSINSSKFNGNIINNINNNIITPKLYKINIEKGMMNNKFTVFNKQLIDCKINSNRFDKNSLFQMRNGIKSHSVKN